MEFNKLLLSFLLLSSLATLSFSFPTAVKSVGSLHDDEMQCVYTVYIRTGTIWKGGTDSIISLVITGADGRGVKITDLASWGGLMGPDHDYYERGNLDIFSGRGPCMPSPPCWMNLTSDGSGPHHGWYCNYVEVTTTGPHIACAQQLFTVEQWLATDTSPYQLYAVRDSCSSASGTVAGAASSLGRRAAEHVMFGVA